MVSHRIRACIRHASRFNRIADDTSSLKTGSIQSLSCVQHTSATWHCLSHYDPHTKELVFICQQLFANANALVCHVCRSDVDAGESCERKFSYNSDSHTQTFSRAVSHCWYLQHSQTSLAIHHLTPEVHIPKRQRT